MNAYPNQHAVESCMSAIENVLGKGAKVDIDLSSNPDNTGIFSGYAHIRISRPGSHNNIWCEIREEEVQNTLSIIFKTIQFTQY